MADKTNKLPTYEEMFETDSLEIDELLYARHAEIKSFKDLTIQRGTPIPALFSTFYRFITNPSAVGVDTFKRMVDTDDTTGAGVDFLMTCLAARIGDYVHPSEEVTKFVRKAMNEVEGGCFSKKKEMASAAYIGFYVGEKVWANTADGWVIKKIAALPPTSVLFEVNRVGEITEDGILQYQRNWNPYGLSQGNGFFGGLLSSGSGFSLGGKPDPFAKYGDLPFPLRTGNTYNYLSIRIPRMKCIHYAFDAAGRFDNPYGRSLLRRCYKYYVLKDTTLQQMSIALDRKGTPLTVVYVDPNMTVKDPNKANPRVNNKGQNVGMSAMEAARQAFENVHNDTTIFLPGKEGQFFKATPLTQESNAQDFIAALEFHNKSIMRGLLIPALIFSSGDGSGSFALGQEHANTWDKILDGMNAGQKDVMLQQWVKETIAYNFPRSAWEKDGLGEFSKRDLSTDEKVKELEVAEKMLNMGALDMNDLNDLNAIREKGGLIARDKPIPQPDVEDDELGDDGMGDKKKEKKDK